MEKRYTLTGLWDLGEIRKFFGSDYTKFTAMWIISSAEVTKGIFLPSSLVQAGYSGERTTVPLEPGTKIIIEVPYTILVGDPTKLPRDPALNIEDLMVEERAIKALALPAS